MKKGAFLEQANELVPKPLRSEDLDIMRQFLSVCLTVRNRQTHASQTGATQADEDRLRDAALLVAVTRVFLNFACTHVAL